MRRDERKMSFGAGRATRPRWVHSLAALDAPPLAVGLTLEVPDHITGLVHPAIGGAVGERWHHPGHQKYTKDKRA
jgi:hypothetical protein